jgi:polar amino acid transport system substrate-binding protein
MKYSVWISVCLGLLFSITLRAQPVSELPVLRIATDKFSPPFVMRGANNQLFGFDIEMMENLCKILHRKCVYFPMPFDQIFQDVQAQHVDLGVGSITITLERAKLVSFSIPYLLSYAQYIGLKDNNADSFSTNQLNNKSIAVEEGSIFKNAVDELGFSDIHVVEMKSYAKIIEALQAKKIDYALVDAPTAQYWKTQSNDQIVPLGKPFLFGYGFGIAVNLANSALLEDINGALLEYQNKGGFQKAYNEYIAHF